MTLPTPKIEDLPKPWRGAATLMSFIGTIAVIVLALVAGVQSVARAQAETTTREVLAKDIETFKREAMTAAERAAREGAEKAIREVVAPAVKDLAEHKARDERIAEDQQREIDRLRDELTRLRR